RSHWSLLRSSPHLAQYLAAHTLVAGLVIRHQALGGTDDGDTETTQHSRDLVVPRVDAAARARHTAYAAKRAFTGTAILERDDDGLVFCGPVVLHSQVGDKPFALEDFPNRKFNAARRHFGELMVCAGGVTNTRQHISYGISQHLLSPRCSITNWPWSRPVHRHEGRVVGSKRGTT